MTTVRCYSCPADYASPATHVATAEGCVGWPLCHHHAWPFAFIAGWKPAALDTPEGQANAHGHFWERCGGSPPDGAERVHSETSAKPLG